MQRYEPKPIDSDVVAALTDRNAVVTGAGRGIGRATSVALARAGVKRIALVARTASELHAAADDVGRAGAEPIVVPRDLSVVDEIADLGAHLIDLLDHVDVLINNAAMVGPLGPTMSVSSSDVLVAFRLNVIAPVLLAGRLAQAMVDREWGRIVNTSSGIVANARNAVGSSTYAATKSALEAHTVALAAELGGTGVTVNAFRPGIVDTAMQEWVRAQDPAEIGQELHRRFVDSHRSGRLLTPQRSGEALVAHLASNATGQIWDIADPLSSPAPRGRATTPDLSAARSEEDRLEKLG